MVEGTLTLRTQLFHGTTLYGYLAVRGRPTHNKSHFWSLQILKKSQMTNDKKQMPSSTCPLITSRLNHNSKGFSKPKIRFFMRDKSAALGHVLQCSEMQTQASVTQGSQIAGQEVIKRSDRSRSQGIVLNPIAETLYPQTLILL